MKHFLMGFAAATAVWLAVLYAQSTGAISLFGKGDDGTLEGEAGDTGAVAPPPEATGTAVKKRRRGKRSHRRTTGASEGVAEYDTSEGMAGDRMASP